MAELTTDQITALTSSGANRWQKNGMDRLYLAVYRIGFRTDRGTGQAWLANDAIPSDYVGAVKESRVWVDAKTGAVGVRLGKVIPPLPADIASYYETILRENAEKYVEEAFKQAEWEEADRRAMSFKSVSLRLRKGQTLTIGGKRFVIERADTISSPSEDKNHMLCDARLIVSQFDGRYRRIDLNETE